MKFLPNKPLPLTRARNLFNDAEVHVDAISVCMEFILISDTGTV